MISKLDESILLRVHMHWMIDWNGPKYSITLGTLFEEILLHLQNLKHFKSYQDQEPTSIKCHQFLKK